jgi:hypothetical protein
VAIANTQSGSSGNDIFAPYEFGRLLLDAYRWRIHRIVLALQMHILDGRHTIHWQSFPEAG